MPKNKSFDAVKKELEQIVNRSPIPTVNVVEEDTTSDVKWRSLTLRANRTITGPYRALKLTPYHNSDGKVTKKISARKMVETYLRFNTDRTEVLIEEAEENNDALADTKNHHLEAQKVQINEDEPFNIVNFDFPVEDDRLSPDGEWINTVVGLFDEYNSNILFLVTPPIVETAKEVLQYQISVFKANLKLSRPIHIAGYVPTISPNQSKKLIDTYIDAGINTIIYDMRNRRINDSSLSHIVAIASKSDNPPYIHALQVNPKRKAKPFDTLFDLSIPSFGIQSISNLRRVGGGSPDNKNKVDARLMKAVKCIHEYYRPKYGAYRSGEYECEKCDSSMVDIDNAFQSGVKARLARAVAKYNAENSHDEMQNIRGNIKRQNLKKYVSKKSGFKPLAVNLDKFEKSVSKEMKQTSLRGF